MKNAFNVIAVGSRDYYEVAVALQMTGSLNKLITDFYCPDGLRGLLAARFNHSLSSKFTCSIIPFLILSKALNSARLNFLRRVLVDFAFGFVAGIYTYLSTDRAIVYSYYLRGFCAFYNIINRRPKTLLCFQVHPSPWFINSAMASDSKAARAAGWVSFVPDVESSFSKSAMLAYKRDLAQCDGIIAASTVTLRSIGILDAPRPGVLVAPYGSKLSCVHPAYEKRISNPKIKLLSVCQLLQRKGIHWVVSAIDSLSSEQQSMLEWVIVSKNIDNVLRARLPKWVTVHPSVTDSHLAELMFSADLFVMPSIVEGFGLVYIEALSTGLPIVYTENTGPHDFCRDRQHGFEVDPSTAESISRVLRSVIESPSIVRSMRADCVALSQNMTWQHFRIKINAFCQSYL